MNFTLNKYKRSVGFPNQCFVNLILYVFNCFGSQHAFCVFRFPFDSWSFLVVWWCVKLCLGLSPENVEKLWFAKRRVLIIHFVRGNIFTASTTHNWFLNKTFQLLQQSISTKLLIVLVAQLVRASLSSVCRAERHR